MSYQVVFVYNQFERRGDLMPIFCSSCGKKIKEHQIYCSGCGHQLAHKKKTYRKVEPKKVEPVLVEQPVQQPRAKKFCSACGKKTKEHQIYCSGCGHQLANKKELYTKAEPTLVDQPIQQPSEVSVNQSTTNKINEVRNTVKKAIRLIERNYPASPNIGAMMFDE